MHLENRSLLYPDTRTPVLSPASGCVSTLPYIPGDRMALTFGGSREIEGITRDRIRRFTDKAGLPMLPIARIVRDTVEATVTSWRKLEHKQLLSLEILAIIDAQIEGALHVRPTH